MTDKRHSTSRRDFLKTSGLLAAGTVLAGNMVPKVHAAEENTIKIALIGCGGRGRGAIVDAISTPGPTKIWALADPFQDKVDSSAQLLGEKYAEKFDCSKERQFVGIDSYKAAIDSLGKGDVALLCAPPCFRPRQLEYAVEKGVNIFMEKSFGVDGPGVRRVRKAGEEAKKKNLKIVGGLKMRHCPSTQACIQKIRDGWIGEPISYHVYRVHSEFGLGPKPEGMSSLEHQLRNFNCFTWTCGSFVLDWMIHNLDVASWVKEDWPVSVQGQGGRCYRSAQDELLDHVSLEYRFNDGKKMFMQLRHIPNSWFFFGLVVHGTFGTAVLGEGISKARIYKGYAEKKENIIWEYDGPKPDPFRVEHQRLFEAIREDKPLNETDRSCEATINGIMGRWATFTGKEIRRQTVADSNDELTPGLDNLVLTDPAPIQPDANGNYPLPVPGKEIKKES